MSQALDPKIIQFIHKMHLLSLALIADGKPYAASSFYAFDELNRSLIVAGGKNSRHIEAIKFNPNIAGTIALDTKVVGRIEGVQFHGVMSEASKQAREIYFRRFPYALAMRPELYEIRLNWIKFTHNALGLGKKIEWSKTENLL